jgi:hypothetical protein
MDGKLFSQVNVWTLPLWQRGMKGDLKGTMLRYKKRNLRIHRVLLKDYSTFCDS